jgi:hypothetical protein
MAQGDAQALNAGFNCEVTRDGERVAKIELKVTTERLPNI